MNKYKKSKLAYDILNVEVDDEFKEIVEKFSEKELSPMEMDLKVRIERVLYVLNRTLAVARVMIYMPTYLKDDAYLLNKFLLPEDVYFILRLANTYEYNFDLQNCVKAQYSTYTNVLENININRANKYSGQPLSTTLANHPNPKCSHMINLLFDNNCIRQLATGSERKKVDKSMEDFYLTLVELKAVVKDMITETGEEELAKNKELRQAYKHNVLVMASNKELEERLQKQRKDFENQLDKKKSNLTMYNKRMETINEEFQQEVEAVMTASEKEMMNRTVVSEEKQARLAEEAKTVVKDFELLMEEHLAAEKVSRSKRFKAETQLHNWVSKYDQDMTERQAEYEALKESYDKESEEMEALQEMFDEQEVEYDVLMQEREEEEDRICNEMAYIFLCNRSARIIQRAWRAYIIRKRARRRGRKGKGKAGKKSA